MEALPILAGIFPHLEFKWERNDYTMGDDIHSHINTFLREIMVRKIEKQTVSICYKDDLRSANIMGELENIPVTTVFSSNNYRRNTGELSRILVVMKETEEKKMMAVFTSFCDETHDSRELHLRVAPTWNPTDYAEFLLEKAISTRPIDMSCLYEGLENSDEHENTFASFLNHCHI